MLTPGSPLNAMVSGIAQGDAAARSILPNPYQPMGKAQAKNPFQGTIDSITNMVLSLAHEVRNQGDEHRGCVEDLYKIAFELSKINNELQDIAEGDESAGY